MVAIVGQYADYAKYGDDACCFVDGTNLVNLLFEKLETFRSCSGLELNKSKRTKTKPTITITTTTTLFITYKYSNFFEQQNESFGKCGILLL